MSTETWRFEKFNCARNPMNVFSNITVLSLEQATVLPYLTYRLALDGMKVIRMEHPVYGDPNRMIGEKVLGEERMNSYFLAINGGKKAITLDLSNSEGLELFRNLITTLHVDIFATNQLPRNYEKLGIDYESVKAIKKDIIWVGITGFGPDNNEVAYDPILQARSGLMELTGERDQSPQSLGIPLPDMGASEHAYGLIMKALFNRAATGEGSRIDLSMFQSSVSWLTVPICLSKSFGQRITRHGNTHDFFAPVSVFKTKDGYVYIAVGNDRQWDSLTDLEPFKALKTDSYKRNEGRIKDVENLNLKLASVIVQFPTDRALDLFNQAQVAVSPINTIPDVLEDPLVKKMVLASRDDKTGTELVLAPPPFDSEIVKTSGRRVSFPPRFGEHNAEVYSWIGVDQAKLADLKDRGII
jgi:crotonobetainyl-CoA:carnitine CoA-transferase CaiB-like acyl-CoA transferase